MQLKFFNPEIISYLNTTKKMNTKAILFIPIAIAMIFAGCSSQDDSNFEAESTRGPEVVRVMELDYSEISRSLTYTAQLQGFNQVHLAPAQPGRIEKIHVEIGNKVNQGDLLAEMDKTQLHQAMVQLQGIEQDFRRLDTLRKVGSVSQQQYDQVKTQYQVAKSNVEFLEENTRLTAPFGATISGKYFENGEMFSGTPNTADGKAAILSLVQTNRLKAIVSVAERYYPHISPGMEVVINPEIYPGESFRARVLRVHPTIDPATRSFNIELDVPNPEEKLRPGMFARAQMDLDQVEAFVVPALAVLKLPGSNERYVFIEKNGRAKRVSVTIGQRFDDKIELISDKINIGDRLVIAGHQRIEDGAELDIRD